MGGELTRKLGCAADVCWLFCSPGPDLESLVKGVAECVGTKNIIGCTTAGEISTAGFSTDSAVLAGMVSDQLDVEVASVSRISRDSTESGRKLAQRFSNAVRYIQLFSDGVTGDGSAILRGMRDVFNKEIPVSGGTSGDAGRFVQTWQFLGDRVFTDAAVAIGFSGAFNLGTGVRSGWAPIGLPKKVTRAVGNILYELNGEPALKVYERFLGKHAKKLPAVGVEYPLGLLGYAKRASGDEDMLLRATMSVNWDDGSIQFAGEVPEDAMVYLTCGDRLSILDATEDAARQAIAELGKKTRPALVFFYSCMARKTLLGLRTREEIIRVSSRFEEPVPIIGFYSYGEYCRMEAGGASLLHNETATLAVIGA